MAEVGELVNASKEAFVVDAELDPKASNPITGSEGLISSKFVCGADTVRGALGEVDDDKDLCTGTGAASIGGATD